jgi:putative hemolysin
MSTTAVIFWLTVMIAGFVLSAVYSGIETGVYSLNRIRMEILADQGRPAARRLRRLMAQPSVLLSTLLIGNNLANYMGTSSLAVLLESGDMGVAQVIVVNLLIATSVLFVFGETIPKDYFAGHSDTATYRFAGFLDWSRRVFLYTGLLPLIVGFSRLVTTAIHGEDSIAAVHPRRQVYQYIREGVGKGLLSDEQSSIVQRVLALSNRRVRDEMVPWPRVINVSVDASAQSLWELADRTSRSRFPVVDADGQVRGILHVLDVLSHDRDACPPVRELMTPAVTLDADASLRAGLRLLQRHHVHMAVVVDGMSPGRPIGIVTPKDLVETITGELTSW